MFHHNFISTFRSYSTYFLIKITTTKNPIAQDFYPTAETIDLALSRGLAKVTEPSEISAFIQHNQDNNTRWADFNPVCQSASKIDPLSA